MASLHSLTALSEQERRQGNGFVWQDIGNDEQKSVESAGIVSPDGAVVPRARFKQGELVMRMPLANVAQHEVVGQQAANLLEIRNVLMKGVLGAFASCTRSKDDVNQRIQAAFFACPQPKQIATGFQVRITQNFLCNSCVVLLKHINGESIAD